MTVRAEASRSVEFLSLEDLIHVAQKQYHSSFFKLLEEKNLKIKSMNMHVISGIFLLNL